MFLWLKPRIICRCKSSLAIGNGTRNPECKNIAADIQNHPSDIQFPIDGSDFNPITKGILQPTSKRTSHNSFHCYKQNLSHVPARSKCFGWFKRWWQWQCKLADFSNRFVPQFKNHFCSEPCVCFATTPWVGRMTAIWYHNFCEIEVANFFLNKFAKFSLFVFPCVESKAITKISIPNKKFSDCNMTVFKKIYNSNHC